MSGTSSAKFYGLNEIPFEPTGAAAGKYPYVPPDGFQKIEDTIKEVISEKKLYVTLLRSPQGGGKTATATEIIARLKENQIIKGPRVMIYNKLMDLDVHGYVNDFLKESLPLLKKGSNISTKIEKNTSYPDMKNILVKVLKHLATSNNITVWIIDEFDILVDYSREKQGLFLQFLRDIIDSLASDRLPILFIMSHTVKSSKDFEKHIQNVHGPFQSRIVNTFDIGYRYTEVREIVRRRLAYASKKGRRPHSIEPFNEQSLESLYNNIVAIGGSQDLTDFRLFERCCYFSILEGAKKNLSTLDETHVRNIFEEVYREEVTKRGDEIGISMHTRNELSEIKHQSLLVRNEAVLRGLLTGLNLMKDDFYQIKEPYTKHCSSLKSFGITINSLSFTADYRKHIVNVLWFLASKERGMVMPGDAKQIDNELHKAMSEAKSKPHLVILSYISNVILEKTAIDACQEIIQINTDIVESLMGLGVATTQEDIKELRKNFDSEIANDLRDIFSTSIKDITKQISNTAIKVIGILFISHYSNRNITKESLKESYKSMEMGKPLQDKFISESIDAGFIGEEGTKIVPTIPRSLINLINELDNVHNSKDELGSLFGETIDYLLHCAEELSVIKRSNTSVSKISPDQLFDELRPHIDTFNKMAANHQISVTPGGIKGKTILSAIENVSTGANDIVKLIVYGVAMKLLPYINRSLGKVEMHPNSAIVTRGTVNKQQAARQDIAPIQVHTPSKSRDDFEEIGDVVVKYLSGRTEPVTLTELAKELEEKGFVSMYVYE